MSSDIKLSLSSLSLISETERKIEKETEKKEISSTDLRTRIADCAIKVMKEISEEMEKSLKGYSKDIKLLDKGIFYGNEYYRALSKSKQVKRIDWLREKGHLSHEIAPKSHFAILDGDSPTGKRTCQYILVNGKASEGLAILRSGLTFMGCGETCILAFYEAFKEVLGQEKFDYLFSATSKTPLRIGMMDQLNPIRELLKVVSADVIKKGQLAYVQGVDELYIQKHHNGEGVGFFTICSETGTTNKYVSLGLSSQGMNLEEIGELLRSEYNSFPIEATELLPAKIAKLFPEPLKQLKLINPKLVEIIKNDQMSPERFSSLKGGRIIKAMDIYVERLSLLIASTNSEAEKLLASWRSKV